MSKSHSKNLRVYPNAFSDPMPKDDKLDEASNELDDSQEIKTSLTSGLDTSYFDNLIKIYTPKKIGIEAGITKNRITGLHEAFCILKANRYPGKDIRVKLNLTTREYGILSSNPVILKRIAMLEHQFNSDIESKFKSIVPRAIEVAEDVLMDSNQPASLRTDVAFKFLDRALGKPKQEIEQKSTLVVELINKLDKMKDVTPTQVIDVPKDSMDNFVEELLPEKAFIVGEKHEQEEREAFHVEQTNSEAGEYTIPESIIESREEEGSEEI